MIRKDYLLKILSVTLILWGAIITSNAQKLVDVEVSIISVEHNFQCCDDAVGQCWATWLYNRPEPRWIINDTVLDEFGVPTPFGSNYLFNPGDGVDCGVLPVNQTNTYTGICANSLNVEMESWENDSGDDNVYDDGSIFGIDPDDNYSGIQNFVYFFLNNPENAVTQYTETLNNGYKVTIGIKWNSYEPAIAPVPPICFGQTASIDVTSALSAGATDFELYSDAGLTMLVANGDPLVTPPVTADVTYYAVQTNGSCISDPTQVDISVLNTFPAPTVDDANPLVCSGDNATITVTSAPTNVGNTFNWYSDMALTNSLIMGATSYTTTGGITGPTTIYVSESNGVCDGTPTAINIDLQPITDPPIASDEQTCENGQATLTAFTGGSNGTFTWYSDAGLNAALSSGPTYLTTPLPDNPAGYNYWVTETSPATGCESAATMVTVTTDLVIVSPSAVGTTICSGETTSLSATSNSSTSGSFFWYNDLSTSDLAYAGNPFNTPAITGTTSYYVVENINGCLSAPTTVVIDVNPLPAPPIAVPMTICAGESATLTAIGAAGDMFWYADASGLSQLNTIASDIYTTPSINSTTTYYVAEMNGFGCLSALTPVIVTVLPAPAPPTTSSISLCEGESGTLIATVGEIDGTITWYDAAGTPIQMDAVPPPASSLAVSGLPVGSTIYYVSYTNTNACESSWTSVTVNVSAQPAAPTGIADVIACEGSTVTINGGTGLFNWYLNMADATPFSTGQVFTSPNPITNTTSFYVAEVVNGCESVKEEVIVNVQPNLPAPNISSNSPVCLGDNIILTNNDATNPAYSYLWTGPNGFSLASDNATLGTTSSSLNSGIYTLEITDVNGCTASSFVIVEVLPAPQSAPLFSNSPVCTGGTIELSTSSVTGATYAWIGPDGNPLAGSPTADPFITVANADAVNGGSYSVSLLTTGGCNPASSSTVVVVTTIPTAPTTADIAVCEGENVELTATGSGMGTLNYYLASGSSVSPVVGTGLAAGTYDYMVTESISGCESMGAAIQVTVTALPEAPITTNMTACEGEDIILSAIADGTVAWTENSDGTNPVANTNLGALAAGTYVYYAWQDNGTCASGSSPLVVEVNSNSFGTPTAQNMTVCEGENVMLSATGSGIGSLNFYNNNGIQVSPNRGALPAGTYNYTVTEGNGDCESLTAASITVTVNPKPIINGGISNNGPLCEGETLELTAPTMAGVTYDWTGPNGATTATTIANVSKGEHQGFYTLVVTDNATGCASDPMTTYVQVNSTPTGIIVNNSGPVCEGGSVNLFATSVVGASYFWDGPGSISNASAQNPTVDNMTLADEGLYTVEITIGDCVSEVFQTYVNVNSGPSVNAGSDIQILEGQSVNLNASGAISYQWSPADHLSSANAANPTFNGPIGTYTYVVTGSDSNSCSSTDEVTVTVVANENLDFVDLFTPNGDGVNDTWTITYLNNVKEYDLNVYARGGTVVLSTSSYNNDWDGTYEGKDLPDGTYWYVLKDANSERVFKGAVTIKR